ncbi:MAG: recombinase family protein, partial [Candidatus Vogelbacteria bacterium]|nr:recombinase family protein [Candidatus Vogelbacteria bacterium]
DFQHGYLEINEEEAKNLRNIFSWITAGFTIRGIVRELLRLGIPPRHSKRGVWATSTIDSILKNQTYVGRGYFSTTYATVPIKPLKKEGYKKVKKTSKRKRPEEEWILIPTPKIIDEDLFNQVQQRLKTNFEASSRNTKNEYLLAGRIFCSCGMRRAGEGSQYGKHRYYRCTNRVHSFPLPPTCSAQGINAQISDQLVWDRLAKIMSSPDLLMKQAEKWLNNWNQQPETSGVQIEVTRKDIAKLKTQVDRYNQAFSEELFDLDKLKEYIAPIREKISLLENQIIKNQTVASNSKNIPIPEKGEIDDFCQQVELKLKNLKFEAKKAIVKDIVEKVASVENQLIVSGYIPINYFNHVALCSSYRNLWPPERR